MAMEEKKQHCQPNFSKCKSEYLSELVSKYKHILECKKTDFITIKKSPHGKYWQRNSMNYLKFIIGVVIKRVSSNI